MRFYDELAELPGVVREKRQSLQELMTPCTAQSRFGRAAPMAMVDTTSYHKTMYQGRFHEAFVPYERN